ncbi:MAG: hypothetical protein F6J93_26745 [Oscillatoria sp. SIO1A7]|nr:hypothetical protein [Oscillatoria sp. SIO1A7]
MRLEIPPFDENGNLPPGVHWADWSDFKERFGTTPRRIGLIPGLEAVMEQLKAAGCRTIYINGSFVTNKPDPKDFDACWDRDDVDIDYLRKNAPIVLNFYNPSAQKAKYGGEIYPSDQPAYGATMTMDLFQRDRYKKNPKGIVAIDLLRWDYD